MEEKGLYNKKKRKERVHGDGGKWKKLIWHVKGRELEIQSESLSIEPGHCE